MQKTQEKFTIIVSDFPSPAEADSAVQLYTLEFYRVLITKLKPDGIFVLQAGSGNLLQIDLHVKLYRTLKEVFGVVRSYSAHVPSFDVPWAYLLCTRKTALDPLKISAKEVDLRIRLRVSKPLYFYDGTTHEGLFRIPKHLRKKLADESGMITLQKPVYLYKGL